jgi:hypothetical protein
VCFLPGTTITLQSVLMSYYALCVSSQALPLHSSLCSQLTKPCVFPPRHYHYTPVCAHYLLSTVCFLPGTTNTLQSVLTTYMPCVFPPRHYYYTPVCAHYLLSPVCVSSQALPLHSSLCSLLPMPCVFPPRHYHYTPVCAHYFLCPVCFLLGLPCSVCLQLLASLPVSPTTLSASHASCACLLSFVCFPACIVLHSCIDMT